jgi:TrmH family RNA methyltransferase
MTIAVAIVEPRLYINVGYVARIMKNFGITRLRLIDPSYDVKKANLYAMHGRDILDSATITNLDELRKCSKLLVGTTALRGSTRLNVLRDTIAADKLAALVNAIPKGEDVSIILGREASGLKNSELEVCDLVVAIETGTSYRTMNISHALGIILYEINKNEAMSPDTFAGKKPEPATRLETDLLIKYVSTAAERAGYDIHKRHLLDSAFKRLMAKANPSSKEVMLMVSLLRKCVLRMNRQENIGPHWRAR